MGRATRRFAKTLTSALLCGLLLAAPAMAFDRVSIMVPAAPGGNWDTMARTMQDVLRTSAIVRNVDIEFAPGAGGIAGLEKLSGMGGQGKTAMIGGLVMVGAAILDGSTARFEALTPLARLNTEWEALVVPAASPIQTMADVMGRLKAKADSLAFGGGPAGGVDHILAAMVARAMAVDPGSLKYVAHSGSGEVLDALRSGRADIGISGVGAFTGPARAGQVRFLAVSSPIPLRGVNAPSLKQSGIDVVLSNWRGLFGPPGMSVRDRGEWLETIDKMVKSDAWKRAAAERGWSEAYLANEEFARFLKTETAQIGATLKSVGLGR